MKKFFLIFMCANIMSTIHSMELEKQPLNFDHIIVTCPNEIGQYLDGKSFASLTQVSSEFQAICNAVPVKYLTMDFSDAAQHKNQNLINRFIAKYDEWICEPETDVVVAVNDNDKNNIIKAHKCSFGKGLQNFLGDYSLRYSSINDVVARYIFGWKDSETISWESLRGPEIYSKHHCVMYLNVGECNDRINETTVNWILRNYGGSVSLNAHAGYAECSLRTISREKHFEGAAGDFALLPHLRSSPDFLKHLAVIATFFVAAMKNDTRVMHALLDNPRTLGVLPVTALRIIRNRSEVHSSKEIQDMIEIALEKRDPDNILLRNEFELIV